MSKTSDALNFALDFQELAQEGKIDSGAVRELLDRHKARRVDSADAPRFVFPDESAATFDRAANAFVIEDRP